jgi:hypothetical protein
MPRDEAILLDIRNTVMRVIDFTRDMDEAAFLDDEKTQSAVLHQLMVLGEAVKDCRESFGSSTKTYRGPLSPECETISYMNTTPWISRKSGAPRRKTSPIFSGKSTRLFGKYPEFHQSSAQQCGSGASYVPNAA